jgi:hypothetical protein
MPKKLISFFLLLSLIAPFAGTFTWLHYKKHLVKKEVKWKMIEGIDKEELVLLKFTQEETKTLLNWKHSREFEFQGEMYDIVETVFTGDSVFYYCWWDHEETHLNKQLNSLLAKAAGQQDQNKDRVKKLYQFFKTLYLEPINSDPAQRFAVFPEHLFFYNECFDSIIIAPPAPPPKLS